jgi:hypothetical protein
MNSLKIPLNPEQIQSVEKEIERLFMLQDKHLDKSKKNFLVQEIEDSGLPFGAIIQGIRALFNQDLKSLKFFVIKESIEKFIVHETITTKCHFCGGHGIVSMVRDDKHSFAFACKCRAGDNWKKHLRWSGSINQQIHGENYTLSQYLLLGDQYQSWLEMCGEKKVEHHEPEEVGWDD